MALSTKFVSAVIDLRFDQPGDRTNQGHLVNSLKALTPILQQIKSSGFNTIVLQCNVPIDLQTGLVDLYAEGDPTINKNKNLPKDFWPIVDYAKKLGLKVLIEPEIVDQLTDSYITIQSQLGRSWSWQSFFQSVVDYQVQIAREAQRYSVDGIYLGVMQSGLVGDEFRPHWQTMVDAVRSLYSGTLLHTAHYNEHSVVWEMVDVVSLYTNPILSRQAMTDYESIWSEYYQIDSDTPISVATAVADNFARYGKPIVIDALNFAAGDTTVGDPINIHTLFFNGQDVSSFRPNFAMQTARYQAALEFAASQSNSVIGVGIDGFSPWQQASWITGWVPSETNNPYGAFARLGSDLAYAPQTLAAISPWIKRNLAAKTLYYGTEINDTLSGSTADERLRGFGGNDTIVSSPGKDLVWTGDGQDVVLVTHARKDSFISIKDFDPMHDSVVLDSSVFTVWRGRPDSFGANNFRQGAKALDRDDFLVWNPSTETLWYDSNGKRSGGLVKIAEIDLVGNQPLSWHDFDVI